MQPWLRALSHYGDPRIFGIFFLSFTSGLPFLLTLSTLSVWLTEVGVSKSTIGIMILATVPYSLKLFWAPVVDRVKIPIFHEILGKRRSWIVVSQLGIMASLISLGAENPAHNLGWTAFMVFCVSFFSASQDCVFEAYRSEILSPINIGAGSGVSVLGYRMGMLAASTGALYLASYFPWEVVYTLMAFGMVLGIITVLCSPEPNHGVQKTPAVSIKQQIQSFMKRQDLLLIILFIFLFKVGDSVMNSMGPRLMLELGFSKIEIANIGKLFGISAMVFGGILGGLLIARSSFYDCLLIATLLQGAASIAFMALAQSEGSRELLVFAVGIENLACGIGASGFIAYLTSLATQDSMTASNYAFFSSVSSLSRLTLSFGAGLLADTVEWQNFYGIVALGCVPAFGMLIKYKALFIGSSQSTLSQENCIIPYETTKSRSV